MRLLLALFLLSAPAALHAQMHDPAVSRDLSPGTPVRIQASALPGGGSKGLVLRLSADTLYFGDARRRRAALPFAAIDRIEVRRNTGPVVFLGIIAGGVAGYQVGRELTYRRERPDLEPTYHTVETIAVTAVGAAIGGLIGNIVAAPWGWKQVFPLRR